MNRTRPAAVPRPSAPVGLTPRRRLFAFLCVIFAVWVIFLLALYFKTVYPERHQPATQAATSAPVE